MSYSVRSIPKISLLDFESRKDDITADIVNAAEHVGFFTVVDHGIPLADIDKAFARSKSFFDLPHDTKATVPWNPQNVGWEHRAQIRPSTGAADQKESYQLQFGQHMQGSWIGDEHLPGFKDEMLAFMKQVQGVSERLMLCLARGLGFADDFFNKAHDSARPDCQTCCRLLHYFPIPEKDRSGEEWHRAGAHSDWDLLTLLFQKEGQSGLEICPGREAVTEFGIGDQWTKVEPREGEIVCNIGDLLMAWSDDRFKSTFHRVKAPSDPGDYYGDRYSIAFFNQPCKDTVIQGPLKKYPVVTGEEFTQKAMQRNFDELQKKLIGSGLKDETAKMNESLVEAAA